ncbi:MAG: DMT family transporter [Polyangiaceae bacterium]|nr:DMT family transporter [Polyangiaceae bacterium]
MGSTRALFAVAVAALAFAWSGPLARLASPAHPLVIAAGRCALAALMLGALRPRALLRELSSAPPLALGLALAAGALLALHFGFFLVGLSRTSLPAAVTLVSLEPVAVVLTAWAWHRVRPARGEALGVALATAGAVIVARGAGGGRHTLAGDLLVVAAVALYGLYLGAARAAARELSPLSYVTLVYALAAAALGVACLAVDASVSAVPARSWAMIGLLALGPTLVGHSLVQWASRAGVSPSIVALVSPGETLGSLVIGAAWLGEAPSGAEALGAAVALTGVVVTARGARAG